MTDLDWLKTVLADPRGDNGSLPDRAAGLVAAFRSGDPVADVPGAGHE